jgi:pimeloyl-ACP methyl ester carboxylesterase
MTVPRKTLVAAAAGATLVVAARRRAAARGVDNPVPEPMPAPPPPLVGRQRTVATEDGIELAVVEHGASEPTATVVLSHGYVQSSKLWNAQVRDLVDARPDLKVVTYDHRGHGRSGRTPRERATIKQLGRDLARVLDAVAPEGPVVVVGHSMGGMTIMALAEEHPELFEGRVVGAGFVGTSAGRLSEVTYGLPAQAAKVVKSLLPKLNEKAVRDELAGRPRKVGAADAFMIFPRGVQKSLVEEALSVHRECSAETVAAFLWTFSDHDRLEALKVLAHVPSVVVVGDKDLLCPLAHSQALAAALPLSELSIYPGVGHMIHMERREEVSRSLLDLVSRAVPARTLTSV